MPNPIKKANIQSRQLDTVLFDYGNTLVLDPFEQVVECGTPLIESILCDAGLDIGVENLVDAWRDSNRRVNVPFISHFYQEEAIIREALGR